MGSKKLLALGAVIGDRQHLFRQEKQNENAPICTFGRYIGS